MAHIINRIENQAPMRIMFTWLNPSQYFPSWLGKPSPLPSVLLQAETYCVAYALHVVLQTLVKIEWQNYYPDKEPPKLSLGHLISILDDKIGDHTENNYGNLHLVFEEIHDHGVLSDKDFQGGYEDYMPHCERYKFDFIYFDAAATETETLLRELFRGPMYLDMEYLGSIPPVRFDTQDYFSGLSARARLDLQRQIEAHAVAAHGLGFVLAGQSRRFFVFQNSFGRQWSVEGHSSIEDGQVDNIYSFERRITLKELKCRLKKKRKRRQLEQILQNILGSI